MIIFPLMVSAIVTFGTLNATHTIASVPKPAPATKHFTIAILGDSMIDTLGRDVPDLKSALVTFFPNATFTIHNLGVGATTIADGIQRIPQLAATRPNIVIVESFGYNPYADLPRYKEQLTILLQTLRSELQGVPIVFAVTIAPNSRTFGDGAPGITFSTQEKLSRTQIIKAYLATAVRFAKANNLPLANIYETSLLPNGDGNPLFISQTDHIHYSPIGRMLVTQKIIEVLSTNRIIQ